MDGKTNENEQQPGEQLSELEQHAKNMMDAIREDYAGQGWRLGNFYTICEVLTPVEGEEDTYSLGLRARYKGGPINALGLLRIGEDKVLKTLGEHEDE